MTAVKERRGRRERREEQGGKYGAELLTGRNATCGRRLQSPDHNLKLLFHFLFQSF